MGSDVSHSLLLIDWGAASRAIESQAESGDRHVVKPFQNGVLVAAVDGLGHGEEAAAAAKIAAETLAGSAHEPLVPLVRRCHQALAGTRGAVMTLALFNVLDDTMTWLGIGSVEGVLLHTAPNAIPARKYVLLRGGVVGYQLPALQTSVLPVTRGDTLILATDGIRSGFTEGLALGEPPQQIADQILARYGKDTDDALVLVVRYLGRTS